MMFGKMYWRGGKEKITKKVEYLAESYYQNRLNKIKFVAINRIDAEGENLSDEDLIGNVKIKLSGEVLPNHFWFIEENNFEI